MKPAILRVHKLSKEFTEGTAVTTVLNDVTFSFVQGFSYAITGASGSGKSTLLHVLAGIESPTAGQVILNDRNIAMFSAHEKQKFLNKKIGLVFQQPYLINELTVLENVVLKCAIAQRETSIMHQQAQELLRDMDLAHKATASPATLSGGQQQRVALARALLNRPQFVIADEPTGNLDGATGQKIIDLLMHYCNQWHVGLIISSHDSAVAQHMMTQLHVHHGQLKNVKREKSEGMHENAPQQKKHSTQNTANR